jgi:molybdate transport system substrate-binding protein
VRRPTKAALKTLTAVAVISVASAALSGCGSSSSAGSATPSGSASAAAGSSVPKGTITVFAASSLTGSFTTLGQQFEAANPGTKVTFSFGPSSGLATQITNGAPADVFASASPKNMAQVVTARAATSAMDFARNQMEIAVPPANPAKITKLADLANPHTKVVLCAAAVPCGSTARMVFTNANLKVTPVSNEVDVKSTLTKVELGEADAGVVYVTDVLAAGAKVKGITIPDADNASTEYPIATLTGSKNAALAKAFVDYVLSADGATALTSAGFEKP